MSGASRRSLAERVSGETRAITTRTRLVYGSVAVSIVLIALTVGAWLLGGGRWLTWPRGIPFVIWGVALLAVFVAVRLVQKRVPTPENEQGIAHGIEREQGLRAGSLRGALEIADGSVLGARAAADVEGRLGTATVLMPRHRQQVSRTLMGGAAAAVVAVAMLALTAVRTQDGFAAVVHPINAWRGLLLPPLAFDALPEEMPRGMPLTVRVQAAGRTAITVSVRAEGDAWRDERLVVDSATSLATLELGPVRAPLTLRVNDGRAPVLERTVTVGDRGWIGDVRVTAVFPSYLTRPTEELEAGGVLRLPRGTELRVHAVAYSGAHDVELAHDDETIAFTAMGAETLEARVQVEGDAEWTWRASPTARDDGTRLPVELPPALTVSMIPDEAPEVAILAPVLDTTIGTSGRVSLAIGARDDHGLRNIALLVHRETALGVVMPTTRIELASDPLPLWDGYHDLQLDGRALEAGDRLIVVAQATDASPWRQRTDSRQLVLRVPTAEEQRQLARSLADSLMNRAAALANAERELQRSTSDAARSRELQSNAPESSNASSSSQSSDEGSKSKMSYESAEKMKAMAQQQRDLGSKVEDLKDGAAELEQRLSDAGAMDKELAQRFQDLQRMLREAMTPEMQKQLEQLEQSADRLSGNEVRQSLEQLSAQQQKMREQLEKSAEMLKRAALEGAMETLRDEAQEVADAERQLSESLKDGQQKQSPNGAKGEPRQSADPRNAQQGTSQDAQAGGQAEQPPMSEADAQRLRDRTRRLEEEVKALTDRLRKEGADAGAEQTQAAQPDMKTASEAMEQAARQMAARDQPQQGQPQQGQPQQGQQQQQQQGQQGQKGQQQQGQQQQQQQQQGQPQPGQPGQQGAPQPGQQGQQGQQGQPQQGQQGEQSAAQQAERAADAMDRAAQQLGEARDAQVNAWKQDLSEQLDQAINETAQLARQQQQLAEKAEREGGSAGMQSEQGALQQGVQQAAERMEQAGRGSALLSQRSQRAMAEAQQKAQQATQALGNSGEPGGSEQAQGAMRDAAQSLNQALSSLVRDRERVNNANSASGFGEMLEQMKELAQQQGSLNGQMQGLSLLPGGPQGQQAQQQARVLARQQRGVAEQLQDVADIDPTGRLEALAREAQQVAQALDRGGPDPATAERQQQLYRRMLDAGRFLEQEERDDQGAREARAGDGLGSTRATGPASGKDGVKYAPPTWNDLRGLSADERRLVYEYFRRLNSPTP